MSTLRLVLLIFAAALFLLAGLEVRVPMVDLKALGLTALAVAMMLAK